MESWTLYPESFTNLPHTYLAKPQHAVFISNFSICNDICKCVCTTSIYIHFTLQLHHHIQKLLLERSTIPYNLHQNKHLLYVHTENLWFVNTKSWMHICIYILAHYFISHTEGPNGQFLPQPWSQVESLKITVTFLTQNLKWMYTLDTCNAFHLCSFLNTTS